MPVQFQKNLINRFREKFKRVDFGPKNSTFIPFWAQQELFFKKSASYLFLCLLSPNFKLEIRKKTILRKKGLLTDGKTDRQTDGQSRTHRTLRQNLWSNYTSRVPYNSLSNIINYDIYTETFFILSYFWITLNRKKKIQNTILQISCTFGWAPHQKSWVLHKRQDA